MRDPDLNNTQIMRQSPVTRIELTNIDYGRSDDERPPRS